MPLTPQDVVLFQGDSITDCGRDRDRQLANDPASLGNGYANRVAQRLLAELPGVTVHNRGISGNRVWHLRDRWAEDALALKPTVLSILIGVNDTWHGTAKGQPLDVPEGGTSLPEFGRIYRELLDRTRAELPDVKLVICEPFALECGAVTELNFHPDIDERAKLVRAIAEDYADVFVPFQTVFNDALAQAGPDHWAGDGVHPSEAGHQLMADAWLDAAANL
ncbi:SGNH/GDSL hydrolase family protein [Algisphaera agarilytica]|uniref:Lysophospholipase L1-like esterase n=1 Tax=Algisphaera agarilytica TaxID=1385975 RepID=A0A7X0H3W7_9BACT|nr:SGNH/GDSL hydrolase family protein [Algisphaera agarilytica]MBB6428801.1 lysophospholipase L1-like esterase [Algisphaera agarilytica]